MTKRVWTTLACAFTVLAFTSLRAADESTVSPAIKSLEGTWATSAGDSIDAKWVFKDDKLETTVNGMDYAGKIKVDDKTKPATLDIEIIEGPDDQKGKTAKGVYKLEGDKLVIAIAVPGHDRPKEFEPVPDEVYLFELTKKKS